MYHKDCMDGFGAALVAWKKFGAQASYIPVSYGTEQDSFVDDMAKSAEHPLSELYVLDFSFNRPSSSISQALQKDNHP